jgi:hypothetical protein
MRVATYTPEGREGPVTDKIAEKRHHPAVQTEAKCACHHPAVQTEAKCARPNTAILTTLKTNGCLPTLYMFATTLEGPWN